MNKIRKKSLLAATTASTAIFHVKLLRAQNLLYNSPKGEYMDDMTNKIEKLRKAIISTKEKVHTTKARVQTGLIEEAYYQINKTSFQQNFKVLIGHYKNETHATRLGSTVG